MSGDDGTRERAGEFALRDAGVRVIGEAGRHGKGKGIRDAVKLASGAIIGFADADNKVPISEFEKLITPKTKNPKDNLSGLILNIY